MLLSSWWWWWTLSSLPVVLFGVVWSVVGSVVVTVAVLLLLLLLLGVANEPVAGVEVRKRRVGEVPMVVVAVVNVVVDVTLTLDILPIIPTRR